MNKHQLTRWLAKKVLDKDLPIPRKPPAKARRTQNTRNAEYLAWIRTQPSVISEHYGCEAAHTGDDGGMSLKASDTSCLPLTPEEHREYHQIGKRSFALKYGLDYEALSGRLRAAWRSEKSGRTA